MLDGILDFSHSQDVQSLHLAKDKGAKAVILKAGQGLGFTDPTYLLRNRQARSINLGIGSYFFMDSGDGAKQADRYLAIADPKPDEFISCDFEIERVSVVSAEHFVEHIHSKLNRWPKWYADMAFMNSRVISLNSPLRQCQLWVARYGKQMPSVPWGKVTLWQVTADGQGQYPHSWPGIVGNIDRSVFLGDEAELLDYWTK